MYARKKIREKKTRKDKHGETALKEAQKNREPTVLSGVIWMCNWR
jgi:hypothetical protein